MQQPSLGLLSTPLPSPNPPEPRAAHEGFPSMQPCIAEPVSWCWGLRKAPGCSACKSKVLSPLWVTGRMGLGYPGWQIQGLGWELNPSGLKFRSTSAHWGDSPERLPREVVSSQ